MTVEQAFTVKPSELKRVIITCLKANEPFFVQSEPGMGKTAIVGQAFAEAGYECFVEDASTADSADVRGVPFFQDGRTVWAPPSTIPLGKLKKPTGVFVDEFVQGPESVQNAWGRAINERRVGGWEIDRELRFGAAGNFLSDRAGTHKMPTQVRDRFLFIYLRQDLHDWVKWAVTHGVDERVIAYHLARRGEYLQKFDAKQISPTARGWERVSNILKVNPDPSDRLRLFAGRVGQAVAGEFNAFLRVLPKVPTNEAILLNPDKAPVPQEPDVLTLVAVNLAHAATENNFGSVIRYLDRLPGEFSVLSVKLATGKKHSLTETAAFTSWAADKADLLT